jgi:hypothetical protein
MFYSYAYEAFKATVCNEVFSADQWCQDAGSIKSFGGFLYSSHHGLL